MSADATGRVLLINSFDDCDMYAEYLRAAGFVVLAAEAPDAAIRLIGSAGCDVVLTDLVFARGDMAGAQFIRELRDVVGEATSIIVISGYVREEDREKARAAGADLFLIKPALPSAVLLEVRRALLLRQRGRRLAWNWRDLPRASSTGARRRPRAS